MEKAWLVKAHLKKGSWPQFLNDPSHKWPEDGWHWFAVLLDKGLRNRRNWRMPWGGHEWIKSRLSLKLLREDVRAGDVGLCYQCEERSILGLFVFASGGKEDPAGSEVFSQFDILVDCASQSPLKLDEPLSLADLKANRATANMQAFRPGVSQGTVFEVTRGQWQAIRKMLVSKHRGNPVLASAIRDYPVTNP